MKSWQNAPKWARNVITHSITAAVILALAAVVNEVQLANAIKEQRGYAKLNFEVHCEDDISPEASIMYWNKYQHNLTAIETLKSQSILNHGREIGED